MQFLNIIIVTYYVRMISVLSDLISQLSDVNIDTNSAVIGAQDAINIRSRLINNDDDDDDDDDDSFTHSAAQTIKSSRQSHSGLFSNVTHVTEPLSYDEQLQSAKPLFTPSVNNCNNNINDYSCLNSPYLGHVEQSAALPDSVKVTHETGTDLRTVLMELGLGKYADVFDEQDVDLPMFLTLNEDDLKEVGIR